MLIDHDVRARSSGVSPFPSFDCYTTGAKKSMSSWLTRSASS
jgi:hypothetical protein